MITLSKSALEKYASCPRCFWLEKREGLKQPEGIRSGLPMGMDRVIKGHYDHWRAKGELPPELQPHLPGWKLYPGDRISMADLRNWRRGLTHDCGHGVTLTSALDDLLWHPERKVYAMLDYKTKAKATNEADTVRYYGKQAQVYDGNLNSNGYRTEHEALFVYYYPVDVGGVKLPDSKADIAMGWGVQPIWLKEVDAKPIQALAVEAAKAIESKSPPAAGLDCNVCNYMKERIAIGSTIKANLKAAAPAAGEKTA